MAHNCIIGGGKVHGLRFEIGFVKCWHSMCKRNAVALLQIASLMAHPGQRVTAMLGEFLPGCKIKVDTKYEYYYRGYD